jgi:MFS family permease
MSGIITAEPFADVFIETRDNETMQGLVTAIYEIGCLMGAMFILGVGDILGRRKAMILGSFVMAIGVILQVTAFPGAGPLAQFITGRVVMGVGNGINTSTIPTYQGETSCPDFGPCTKLTSELQPSAAKLRTAAFSSASKAAPLLLERSSHTGLTTVLRTAPTASHGAFPSPSSLSLLSSSPAP